MKALILGGGLGTRLYPITYNIPKSLVIIGNFPILERQVKQLAPLVDEIVLAVGYLSSSIKYFIKNNTFDVKITLSIEDKPLGTGGALKLAEKYLTDTFFMLNGDIVFEFDLKDMLKFYNENKTIGTIAGVFVNDNSRYGTLQIDGKSIVGFHEKSKKYPDFPINAGIYILEPEIFSYIKPYKKVSIEKDIFDKLSKNGKMSYYPAGGFWKDIGTIKDLKIAHEYLEGSM